MVVELDYRSLVLFFERTGHIEFPYAIFRLKPITKEDGVKIDEAYPSINFQTDCKKTELSYCEKLEHILCQLQEMVYPKYYTHAFHVCTSRYKAETSNGLHHSLFMYLLSTGQLFQRFLKRWLNP